LGEFYAGPDKDALQRWKDFRAKGFAGGWAWSLFPDRTADKFQIDLAAATSFTSSQSTALPASTPGPDASPVPTPVAEGVTTQLLASWISPTYATPGQDVALHQEVRSDRDLSVLVDFEVYDDKDQKIWQSALDNQALSADSVSSLSVTFTLPAALAPGQYRVKSGVFAAGWGSMYGWSDQVGLLIVEASDLSVQQTPDPSPATPNAPGSDGGG
jgi:hypothetical protein